MPRSWSDVVTLKKFISIEHWRSSIVLLNDTNKQYVVIPSMPVKIPVPFRVAWVRKIKCCAHELIKTNER